MPGALRRRLAGPAILAALTLVALAGCADTAPTVRHAPNAVELSAVQRTSQAYLVESYDIRLPWVQLWTISQFPKQMQNCTATESYGNLGVTIDQSQPLKLESLSYQILGSGAEPNEAEASRIIARCAAATPLDDRALRLPAGDADQLYSYDLTILRPCLLAHGYQIAAMPSRARFEQLLAARRPVSPYDTVVVTTRAAWYALSDACPPLPNALNSAVSHG